MKRLRRVYTLTSQSATEEAKAALMLLGNASTQMAKERRKKVTKDFNRDLMSLAEDLEMFEEAALLLFGASFEKKMKDHLESLKCLRQSMAPKSGYHDIIYKTRVIPSAHPPA